MEEIPGSGLPPAFQQVFLTQPPTDILQPGGGGNAGVSAPTAAWGSTSTYVDKHRTPNLLLCLRIGLFAVPTLDRGAQTEHACRTGFIFLKELKSARLIFGVFAK